MKFALIVALALPAIASAPDAISFSERVERFNTAWNRYYRAYHGCPREARDIAQCDEARGGVDYRAFLDAAKEARKLFTE